MAPSNPDLDALVSAVETWQGRRVDLSASWSLDGYRQFCEVMNYHTRTLIRKLGKEDPEFFSALAELAVNAQTLTTRGAKLRANGTDMTQV